MSKMSEKYTFKRKKTQKCRIGNRDKLRYNLKAIYFKTFLSNLVLCRHC